MNPTLKPRVNVFKGQIACDDNVTDTASIYPFYLDSSEVTDIDPFSDSSDITSTDLSILIVLLMQAVLLILLCSLIVL